jgi:hypothetical protein
VLTTASAPPTKLVTALPATGTMLAGVQLYEVSSTPADVGLFGAFGRAFAGSTPKSR